MDTIKREKRIAGWLTFAISFIVYFFSAERTGSLWDCGEFMTGADKLEVVHPPGAPLFMIVARMFALLGHLSDDPANIAFMVNLSSGLFTAFAAMFVALTAMEFGKLALAGREGMLDLPERLALAGGGVVAGLVTAFAPSIWFSAVESEVYALSTFFTTMTFWAAVKWYALPREAKHDKWLVFSLVAAGISIGVHLLSLLVFPAIALLYYFKKYARHTWVGGLVALVVGVLLIGLVQKLIITGIPNLWGFFEIPMVNTLGLPRHSGLVMAVLVLAGLFWAVFRFARRRGMANLYNLTFALALMAISYMVYGVIVVRANAEPAINMNNPNDALRLIPYLNREQYGERSLLRGPQYTADVKRDAFGNAIAKEENRYGWTGERYEIVDKKQTYEYRDRDKVFFPRMYDPTPPRPQLYELWMGHKGPPTAGDNLRFFWRYQVLWMWGRYFMWNFVGKQNGEQGFYDWDKSKGNWISGIRLIDNAHLGFDQRLITKKMKEDKARNTYYFIPFLLGLLGAVFHYRRRPKDFAALLVLFLITGVGLVVYSNEPPNEPRERDYVFVGSFFTYAIWVGLAVPALFRLLRRYVSLTGLLPAGIAVALGLTAPVLMGTQNFDDYGRKGITAARDYAHNFLESCAKNAIVFTYGDNDTYPLWYAQEIEGIRTDVRVVNLSLIAVDWYIDLLRRKVNDSPPIKLTIPKEAYRGYKRNMLVYASTLGLKEPPAMPAREALKFAGEHHPIPRGRGEPFVSYFPAKHIFIPVDKEEVVRLGVVSAKDTARIVSRVDLNLSGRYMIKDQLAVLDVIASNLWERPIYFAVTCREEKVAWYKDYLRLEGLASRIVPIRTLPEEDNTSRGGGVTYMGDVDPDIVLQNVKKFWWGNFDKKDLFVDHSYGAAVQSHREVMYRAARAFVKRGQNDKAAELINIYFKAFPDMNFPYDYFTARFLELLTAAGHYAEAKKHLKILEQNTLDNARFLNAIDPSVRSRSFGRFESLTRGTISNMMKIARAGGDTAYAEQLQKEFAFYIGPAQPKEMPPQKSLSR